MQKLKTVDADTLLSTPLPANQFVVERLLPQGLHILAGASKVGKSWLALWLCLCVAKGEPVWGLTTARGTVLYLCLEDSLSRIQGRLFQLTENAPAALHFATMAGNIGKGLEEQIEGFLQMHRDTVLVVIDTLQKVRISISAANPYANDYQDLSSLKALADRYRVAILAIHHIRKMQDDDPFNRISGTTGISGVADTNLVLLKQGRSGVEATLHCVGRDVEYRELHLKFQNCRWLLTEPLEEQKQEPVSPEVLRLAEFLKGLESFDGTATELAMLWEGYAGEPVQPSVLSKKQARYAGELDKLGVHITTSRTRESRSLHLRHCEGLCARSAPRAGETSQAMQRPFGRFVPGVEHPGIYSRFGAICAGRKASRIKAGGRNAPPARPHRPATRLGKRICGISHAGITGGRLIPVWLSPVVG